MWPMPGTHRTDSDDARDIATQIAIEMIRKTGVQEYEDAGTTKAITKRSIEMARDIIEAFPNRK